MEGYQVSRRKTIGIITGSGPEAGVDLWVKVLEANRRRFGEDFRGDLDAPPVTIISEPELGLSMEMAQHAERVWRRLEKAARNLSPLVDCYAVACNTLNCFQDRLSGLALTAPLVSFSDVVAAYIRKHRMETVGLLGAKPVTDLSEWSAYRRLASTVSVEVPKDAEALHQLIYDVKIYGAAHEGFTDRFKSVLEGLKAETVLLACTELPLIPPVTAKKTLLDVTRLVAETLVDISLGRPPSGFELPDLQPETTHGRR
jgi:aspartate racemase